MSQFKCKICGGDLKIIEGTSMAKCEYCHTEQPVPKVVDESDQHSAAIQTKNNDSNNAATYYSALSLLRKGTADMDIPTIEQALLKFKSIIGWKDSAEKIAEGKKAINDIVEQRRLDCEKIIQKAQKKRKKKRILTIGAVLASIAVIVVLIPFFCLWSGNYKVYIKAFGVTHFEIPYGVTTIESTAFENCSKLLSVTIPDSVTTIDYCAFEGCSSLTSITIPDSVTAIAFGAFSDCTSLTSIKLPKDITIIESWMFSGCSSLTSITLPGTVEKIETGAFRDCSNLTSVTIPKFSFDFYIMDNAFQNCKKLKTIYYGGSWSHWREKVIGKWNIPSDARVICSED